MLERDPSSADHARSPNGTDPHTPKAPYLTALEDAAEGWLLYSIWPVDDSGVCACSKRGSCPSPGKHPMTRRGSKEASADPRKLAALFARNPEANVGLRCGAQSGVVALDVDPRHGGLESLERSQREHGALATTRTHFTGGGGFHYLFAFPEDGERVPSIVAALPDGLELKADGNQIVLPPSNHASGERYRILNHGPLAPLPEWLLRLARDSTKLEAVPRKHGAPGGAPESGGAPGRFRLPERVPMGARNDTLFRYACSLRACAWSRDEIFDKLNIVNRERCDPPLGSPPGALPVGGIEELRKIAESAAGFQPGHSTRTTAEVLAAVTTLEEKAAKRAKSGMGAHSRWAVYRALLGAAKEHGSMKRGDVAVRIGVRELALGAGISRSTVHRALNDLEDRRLVYRTSRGDRDTPSVLALRAPAIRVPTDLQPPEKGGRPDTIHPPSPPPPPIGVSLTPILERLYRLRWGPGRIGKTCASLLEKIVESPGESRKGLACQLGRKPESLKKPLKKLLDRDLIERVGHGRYRPVDDLEQAIDRERLLSGEKKADSRDERLFEEERLRYREEGLGRRDAGMEREGYIRALEGSTDPRRYWRVLRDSNR